MQASSTSPRRRTSWHRRHFGARDCTRFREPSDEFCRDSQLHSTSSSDVCFHYVMCRRRQRHETRSRVLTARGSFKQPRTDFSHRDFLSIVRKRTGKFSSWRRGQVKIIQTAGHAGKIERASKLDYFTCGLNSSALINASVLSLRRKFN